MKAYSVCVRTYNDGLWDSYPANIIYLNKEKAEDYVIEINKRLYEHKDVEYFVMRIEIVE